LVEQMIIKSEMSGGDTAELVVMSAPGLPPPSQKPSQPQISFCGPTLAASPHPRQLPLKHPAKLLSHRIFATEATSSSQQQQLA